MSIITFDDLRSHLGIEDSEDDISIIRAVNAGNERVAKYCGAPYRIFDKTSTDDASARVYRPTDQCELYVHDFWTTTALEVKVDFADSGTFGTTWALDTDFILEPTNAVVDGEPFTKIRAVNTYFPIWNVRPSVQVTAPWGWPAMPARAIEAALLEAAKVWKRKDSPEGVLGGFGDFNAVRVSQFADPDAARDLQPLRRADRLALVR
jgi:hypothetical protein